MNQSINMSLFIISSPQNSLKQLKTANSPWAYIWEGLLSEGFLCLRFGGLIFERAYEQNFTVLRIINYGILPFLCKVQAKYGGLCYEHKHLHHECVPD